MADARLGVLVSLKDEATTGLNRLGKEIDAVGDHSTRASTSTDNFARALGFHNVTAGQAVGALLGVSVGLAAVAAVGNMVKDTFGAMLGVSVQFGSEMAGVAAVSGATAGQMARLSDAARVGGLDIGVGAIEGAKGLQELVKGGVSVEAALGGGLRATELMAKAGGVDLAQAAEISAVALNSFGLNAATLPHVADLVAGAANASSIGVEDFRLSLSQAGAVARTIGVTFDDTAVAIAELGQAGIKGSDAGTSLRTFLLRLAPTTAEAEAEMRKLGIITADGTNKFFDASGKAKSLADVSEVLKVSLRGMSDQQKVAALNTIFGTDAIRSASVFAREGSGGFNALSAAMAKISATDVARKRLDSLSGDLQRLQAQSEATAVSFGKLLEPLLRGGARGANEALAGVEKLADSGALAKIGSALLAGPQGIGTLMLGSGMAGAALASEGKFKPRVSSEDLNAEDNLRTMVQGQLVDEQKLRDEKAAASKIVDNVAAGKRLEEVIGQRINVLSRENLDLKVQEASAQSAILPIRERQAEIDLSLLQMADRRNELSREGAAIQARMAAAGATNRLEDMDFEERRLRLKIKTDALAGRGVAAGDIAGLMSIARGKPEAELAALMAGRPGQLLDRASKAAEDAQSLKTLPMRMDQVGVQLEAAMRERELGRINAQVEAARLNNAPELAGLEAKKRALEDAAFNAAQAKADKQPNAVQLNIQQHITSTGEVDYQKILEVTYSGVIGALKQGQQQATAPAQPGLPGSRGNAAGEV